MNPQQFKKIRESFGLTQKEIANCLGLIQKTVSQYEMGFRKPGPTVQVIMRTLDRVSAKQLKDLLDIMNEVSEEIQAKNSKRKTD
ncbi:MAG: helix-turn-helix domain-containing protein [Bdellovibrionaceae bacterium]|nr:helix-turn-helix domain-containing protein [Pseudobdellovibrionaceae bacterium]